MSDWSAYEQALAERFPAEEPRKRALAAAAESGWPHPRAEDWRYADLSPLRKAVLAPRNDAFARSDLAPVWAGAARLDLAGRDGPAGAGALPGGVTGEGLDSTFGSKPLQTLDAVNLAFAGAGGTLSVDKGVDAGSLEMFVQPAPGKGESAHARLGIRLADGARVQILLRHDGADARGWTNLVILADLGEGAALDIIHDFTGPHPGLVTLLERVSLAREAQYRNHSAKLTPANLRHEVETDLNGEGAHMDLGGVLLAGGAGRIDTMTRTSHHAGNCTSEQFFRGVAGGTGAVSFSGRITVDEGADGTDAVQNAKNLLLDAGATANVKPELIIYADDVKCAHGATVGEMDRQALFYLRQRGLSEAAARALLVRGFAGEAIDRIGDQPVQDHFHDRLARSLAGDKA